VYFKLLRKKSQSTG